MSACVRLQTTIKKHLAAELNLSPISLSAADGDEQYGVLFDELVALLLDIALGLLENCLANSPLARIAESIHTGGVFERYLIRKAVRRSHIPERDRKVSETVLEQVLASAKREEAEELLQEIELRQIDWSLF